MKTFKKIIFCLTVLAVSIAAQPPTESYAQGWRKFGKILVTSFAKGFGKAAAEVSVQVLADQLARQTGSRDRPNRSNKYVYNQLHWNYYGSQHSGILSLGPNGGFLRVAFYNTQLRRIEAIDQKLVLREKNGALFLLGSTPKYAGTNRTHPNYLPDILLLQQDYYGNWRVAQVGDRRGYFVPVVQAPVSRSYRQQYPQLFR